MASNKRRGAAGETIDTEHLVHVAAELGRPPYTAIPSPGDPVFQDFVQTLRDWIVEHYDLPGSRLIRVEKTHLLMHLMRGAPTLGDAIALLERFRTLVWGDRGIRTIAEGDRLVIQCEQPFHKGVPGLLSDLWTLSFLLTEFEFLAGGPLDGAAGHVRLAACLPAATARLLFDHSLTYEAATLALVLPRRHLRRPIVPKADEVGPFLDRLVPRTLGAEKMSLALTALVAGMIQAETRHAAAPPAKLEDVAQRLGVSAATLRRRLTREGSTFRDIKERVLDALAKEWLTAGLSVEGTAERLGYSDTFAFRRAFHRRQHCSPSAFRRMARAEIRP